MALRARNASPSGRATLNPQSTCHGPPPGPKLAHGVREDSLRATEPRARGKTRSRKRKNCRRATKTHLFKALSCLRCVGNNMSEKHFIYYIIPTRKKTACKPWVQQYATDVKNLLYLARLEFLCKTGCVPHYFQYKEVAFLFFPQNLSLKILIRFLTSVGYCSTTCTIYK